MVLTAAKILYAKYGKTSEISIKEELRRETTNIAEIDKLPDALEQNTKQTQNEKLFHVWLQVNI